MPPSPPMATNGHQVLGAGCNIALLGSELLVLQGLRQILQEHGLQVHCAQDEHALWQLIDENDVRVIVILELSDSREISILRHIMERRPDLRIVLLLHEVDTKQASDALETGCRGVLLRTISAKALFHSIQLIFLDETVLSTPLAASVLNRGQSSLVESALGRLERSNLSARDIEMLGCLVEGLTNKSIARRLNLGEATIKVHLRQLLKKIGAENRTQAATWALGQGMDTLATRGRDGDPARRPARIPSR